MSRRSFLCRRQTVSESLMDIIRVMDGWMDGSLGLMVVLGAVDDGDLPGDE